MAYVLTELLDVQLLGVQGLVVQGLWVLWEEWDLWNAGDICSFSCQLKWVLLFLNFHLELRRNESLWIWGFLIPYYIVDPKTVLFLWKYSILALKWSRSMGFWSCCSLLGRDIVEWAFLILLWSSSWLLTVPFIGINIYIYILLKRFIVTRIIAHVPIIALVAIRHITFV